MLSRERIIETLLELTDRTGGRSREALLEKLLRNALALAECDGVVVVATQNRQTERLWLRRGQPRCERAPFRGPVSEFVRLLQRHDHPLALADVGADGRMSAEELCPGVEGGPALFVPLRFRENGPAWLAVFRRRGGARFGPEDTALVTMLAAWAAMAVENLRLSESLERLAVTDDLTQVYNYRFLKTALRREIKRAGRFGQVLSLIMLDVDNLKTYNDQHGHLRGSHLLREMAGLLAEQVRSFDLVAKYGGDEFSIILPQTEREGAMVVAQRVRSAIERHAFPLVAAGQITVSLGLALFPSDGSDVTSLIQAADRALYLAKKNGRNRVEVVEARAA
ncbi:MAG TPA: sensor domain-containing diguanylate cyclase [Candidatus Sulfotelmatobacter sp.]|nr:sensor domain-containing diguanylate cyclase [Candidatus Sulfotelmatobacter sp.]